MLQTTNQLMTWMNHPEDPKISGTIWNRLISIDTKSEWLIISGDPSHGGTSKTAPVVFDACT